jgi:lysozyme
LRGIDVSYAQGRVDWRAVARDGVGFAMVKASQGRLLKDASVGPFADPRFAENVRGAAAAGLAVGVYHYLCAGTVEASLDEADFFLETIRPYRREITLWAVCDCEEDKYLPRDGRALTNVVRAFMKKLRFGGFRPMLYSNPNYLRYRFRDLPGYDLWLAYWGATEARALSYAPKIWQYGVCRAGNLARVDGNVGYFTPPL